MANNQQSSFPTYVLKVNLHCCNACPKRIRKKLSKIPGVISVDMNIQSGFLKISVAYNLDPSIFVKTIAKSGKKALFPVMDNRAPPPVGNNPQFPGMDNRAPPIDNNPHFPAMDNRPPAPMGNNPQFPAMNNRSPAPIGNNSQFPAMDNRAPAPIGNNPQFPAMENRAPAATIGTFSGHHYKPSINSDNHCYKSDRTQYGNSDTSHFSDHRGRSDKVHINEPAAVNPPVALPLHNRMFMRPPSQYGDVGCHGSHGFWSRMSEPLTPMAPVAPAHSYYRSWEPVPLPVGNAPGHYLFNDENTEGCVIV